MNSDRENEKITKLRNQYDQLLIQYNSIEEPFNNLDVQIAVLEERLNKTIDANEKKQFEDELQNLRAAREPLAKPEVRAEVARLSTSIKALKDKLASLEHIDPSSPSFRTRNGMSNKSNI